ncbi:hypothetical protein [Rhodococcus chondri]|uniref:Uncharacterized protein n=1 Tax=Rhodococcus chondri TaxID=3065941 RepID=A0ABU7JVZ5_9NOCA|nr:hypothetical protein [Rhodococcus sp. CC-R104]MEE2034190.1 hypothetical protein [Rhodococcus sp. CC-R104]
MLTLLIVLSALALSAGSWTVIETARGGRCGLDGPPRSTRG